MTEGPQAISHLPATEPLPDWSTIDREILCPLCDYNLRGLVEPRCPECGYRTTWTEVLDRSNWEHEWLFEHRRGMNAFFRTLFTSLRPRRFWRSVLPTNTPKPRRLIWYWAMISGIFALIVGAIYLVPITAEYQDAYELRQQIYQSYQRPPAATTPWRMSRFKTAQEAVEFRAPYPTPWEAFASVRRQGDVTAKVAAELLFVGFIWPWLTALTLMLFRETLQRARIRPVHILRCAVYSSDVLPVVLTGLLIILSSSETHVAWFSFGYQLNLSWIGLTAVLAAGAVLTHRLGVAYVRYLRFPHAAWTVIAAQAIVLLVFLALSDWRFLI